MIINGDFTDDDWLLLVEDSRGLGSVLGYVVFDNETDAERNDRPVELCRLMGLFTDELVPQYVTTEILTYGDFRSSYGNRMTLVNRWRPGI